jgi:hypothetical protein
MKKYCILKRKKRAKNSRQHGTHKVDDIGANNPTELGLEERGLEIFRYSDHDVNKDFENFLISIWNWIVQHEKNTPRLRLNSTLQNICIKASHQNSAGATPLFRGDITREI